MRAGTHSKGELSDVATGRGTKVRIRVHEAQVRFRDLQIEICQRQAGEHEVLELAVHQRQGVRHEGLELTLAIGQRQGGELEVLEPQVVERQVVERQVIERQVIEHEGLEREDIELEVLRHEAERQLAPERGAHLVVRATQPVTVERPERRPA